MPESERYSIIFNGNLLAGARRSEALKRISLMTNIDADELLDSLFSVKPVVINQVQERELAETYREAFQNAGLELVIEPYSSDHDEIINAEIVFSHYAPIARQDVQPNYLINEPNETAVQPCEPNDAEIESGPIYHLIFNGELKAGINKKQAIENICNLTKSESEEVIEQIFSVVPVVLIQSTDPQMAEGYLQDFTACGLKVTLTAEQELDNSLAISTLRVREDRPPPPMTRKVSAFVFLLVGLTLFSFILWSAIYLFNKGYFEQEAARTIDIKLDYPKVAPVTPVTQPPPIAEIPNSEATPKPITPQPIDEPKAPPKVAASAPLPRTTATPVQKSDSQKATETRLTPQEQSQLEQEYFIALLNWFARPEHQRYDQETRQQNLEGEITIQISIYRNGHIKEVNILSSSSEKLTQATKASAMLASPYPPLPKEITGETYNFTLPLKYALEDGF